MFVNDLCVQLGYNYYINEGSHIDEIWIGTFISTKWAYCKAHYENYN